jgi:hypothetical protein
VSKVMFSGDTATLALLRAAESDLSAVGGIRGSVEYVTSSGALTTSVELAPTG